MKKTRLTIGPAASALGTSVLTPTPSAVKLSMPTMRTRTNGHDVGRAVHVVAEAADQQHQHDLDRRHDHGVDEDGGQQHPGRERAEAQALEQAHLAAVHQLMAKMLKQAAMMP